MRRGVIVTVLLCLHLIVFVYPLWRIGLWLDTPSWLLSLLTVPLVSSQYIARRKLYKKGQRATRTIALLRNAIDYLLGVFSISALMLLVLEPLFLFAEYEARQQAGIAVFLIAFLTAWGSISAWRPRTRRVHFESAKLTRTWRIVQLSDVHIGSRSRWFLKYLRWRVNRMQPDLVCITGDLIDQPGLDEHILADLGRFTAPVYYVTGNHERYEDHDAILQRLANLGVHVLRQQRDDWQELSLIGIDDADDPAQVKKGLSGIKLDPERFSLLLYHKPVGLHDAAAYGVDLMLSGHTHGGQIWPFHLAVKTQFSRHKGVYREAGTILYVSEGTGTWGPALRLFSSSEITLIHLEPV
ncbi:MAG: metallophosphoesterase [Oleiphilaceae bacterium]|nr:metallophosphoesterase [Oleiphilaceae bacterium]